MDDLGTIIASKIRMNGSMAKQLHLRFWGILLTGTLFATFLPAQERAVFPAIIEGAIDWSSVPGINDDFSKKDAVMGIIRQTNQMTHFVDDAGQTFLNDFHFIDLNGDKFPEAIYMGKTPKRGWHTTIFTAKDYRYEVKFDSDGYVGEWNKEGDNYRFVIREDPGEREYLTRISQYRWRTASESDTLLSELVFPGPGKQPNDYFPKPVPAKIGKPVWVRHSPEVVDDPAFDYNEDGRLDGAGNKIAAFPKNHPAMIVSTQKDADGYEWAFIVTPVADPAPGHVFDKIRPGVTFTAGWILEDYLLREKP